jgi:hypothetical protein
MMALRVRTASAPSRPPSCASDVEAVGYEVAAGALDDPGRDRPVGREGLAVAQEVVLVAQVADACVGPGAPTSFQSGRVGFGGDLLRGPGAVAGQHGEGPGRDPVLGGGVPGRVEAPCGAPQIFKNVNYVDDDVDRGAPAGGLGADEVQLVLGAVDQVDPGAQVQRVAGLCLVERGGDDLGGVLADGSGQPLGQGLRPGTGRAGAVPAAGRGDPLTSAAVACTAM